MPASYRSAGVAGGPRRAERRTGRGDAFEVSHLRGGSSSDAVVQNLFSAAGPVFGRTESAQSRV
jgi:hypothetical protein